MAREFWSGIRSEVQAAIDRVRPRRATVATVGTGTVTITELGETTASTEPLARLAGFDLAANHEVLVADVAGKPLVLGRIQRGAIADQDLTVRNLTVTGTSTGAGGLPTLANGFVAQTATTPAYAGRTLQAGGSISITNPAGILGDPTIALASSVTIATALTLAGKTINTATGIGVVASSAVKTYVGTAVGTTTVTLTSTTVTLVNGIVYDVIGYASAQGSASSTGTLDLLISVAGAADVTGSRCGTASGERPIFAFDMETVTGTGAAVTISMKAKGSATGGTVQSGLVIAVAIPRGPVLG